MGAVSLLIMACALSYCHSAPTSSASYRVGTGIADVTGPAAEINMMGYGKMDQKTGGIHTRLFSRAFIIADARDKHRVVYVTSDIGMMTQIVRKEVLMSLKVLFGDMYRSDNVMLSSTHTHSGPAAYHQFVLFEITSLGFYEPSFKAIVDGIVESIVSAHNSMVPADIFLSSGELFDSNINRSPLSYLQNPAEERAKYQYDVDKEMTLIKMIGVDGKDIGMLNWFAVHPVSMNNTNQLISSDNKGYAALLFEEDFNHGFPGQGPFVGAFAQANEGDVSSNTRGPHCLDTGLPCDVLTSTCNGKVELCVASGPGRDMFESTKIIATNQYDKAKELYHSQNQKKLSGPLDYRYVTKDMSSASVTFNGKQVSTCKPSMGFSFAAGTTDGPGEFNFKQGDTEGNAFWNIVRNFISKPSKEIQACHAPKPILLPTGEISFPYAWQPEVVDFQLLRVGQLVIIGVPGEFTTMSGRRAREAVRKTLLAHGLSPDTKVVLSGLTNSYADYITTFEEYQLQRYEGASTVYGPHTLQAMIDSLTSLAEAMAQGKDIQAGPEIAYLRKEQLSFIPPVIYDNAFRRKGFGGVLVNVQDYYTQGDHVRVEFVSANPRNTDQVNHTFMSVEQKQPDGSWLIVVKDSAWETKFTWVRTSTIRGKSKAIITWDIPTNQEPGTYRIRHSGHYKKLVGDRIIPFTGTTGTFRVSASGDRNNANRTKWFKKR